jgi:hypothetical protein
MRIRRSKLSTPNDKTTYGNKGWRNHSFTIDAKMKLMAIDNVFNFLGKEILGHPVPVIFGVQAGPVRAGSVPGKQFFCTPLPLSAKADRFEIST